MRILFLVALVSSVGAFCPQRQTPTNPFTALEATSNGKWWSATAAAAAGWTLAAQIAGASIVNPVNEHKMPSFASQSNTLVITASETIDFSLPSYNPNMGGFGDGTEARLTEAKGGDEGNKQKEAMQKAEAARQERLKEKKEAAKAREQEERLRAKAKKEAQKDRFKEIFQ